MSLLGMLIRGSRTLFAAAILASLACGVGGALLVLLINRTLHAPAEALPQWLLPFVAAAVLVMVAQVASRALFARLGQRALGALRQHIAEAVVAAPYRRLEVVGRARVQSLLTDDASAIATFCMGLPILVTNGIVILGVLAYLATLSWSFLLLAGAVMVLGSIGHQLSYRRVLRHFRQAGRGQDRLFGQFEALNGGAKELKLNDGKARRFLDVVLAEAIDAVARSRIRGLSLLAFADGWGRLLFMATIGTALFARIWIAPGDAGVVTGYVIAFLYIMGPLEGLLANIPHIGMARVALGRIGGTLAELEPGKGGREPAAVPAGREVTLALEGVTHGYYDEREDEVFTLGPIDLTLRPGEITFLVGGNGSGKTTLAKLVTGLYAPESGTIRVDGQALASPGGEAHRQLFSAVFSDFHLFETLLETADGSLDARANDWLRQLHLDHKVAVRDGAFSTRDLSQGQRKRLALVAACLEDRPVMVFDEWAADQDPQFKDVFYREVLAELKARRKTLLVITHDDRWFPLADQLIKLDRGQVVERSGPAAAESPVRAARGRDLSLSSVS
ncbi:cyclic peptide export ABC transporter [Inquilinus limosus]|uniref:cyclic peptide export ABC transporter n=1 Tax=Inquilinus limosus TaxID=171674 RepID=UPI0004036910|nr:cyclic peptide export ABC transporter [Inquilinus limosus]